MVERLACRSRSPDETLPDLEEMERLRDGRIETLPELESLPDGCIETLPEAESLPDGRIVIADIDKGLFQVTAFPQSDAGSALYGDLISNGETSSVFATEFWPFSFGDTMPTTSTIKVAIKRLYNRQPEDIMRECNALELARKRRHPNIVELITTFTYRLRGLEKISQGVYYNLAFPFAKGNLEQLLTGNESTKSIEYMTQGLWSQLEGLASALAYLHDECHFAHGDLKPSNILIYETGARPALQAKIADFGMAVDLNRLNTWPSSTVGPGLAPRYYNAPEVLSKRVAAKATEKRPGPVATKRPTRPELCLADVRSLGCVFAELVTFLIGGSTQVRAFRIAALFGSNLDLSGNGRRPDSYDLVERTLFRIKLDRSEGATRIYPILCCMVTANESPTAQFITEWLHEVCMNTIFTEILLITERRQVLHCILMGPGY